MMTGSPGQTEVAGLTVRDKSTAGAMGQNQGERGDEGAAALGERVCSSVFFTGKDMFVLPDGSTYHLGVKSGDLHPRILTVGCFKRAAALRELLDSKPAVKSLSSFRNFDVHSGYFCGTPVSIVAIGMGAPMMDFLLREGSFVLRRPMAIIRLGTCGLTQPNLQLGDVVVAGEGSCFVYTDYAAFDGYLPKTNGKGEVIRNEEEEGGVAESERRRVAPVEESPENGDEGNKVVDSAARLECPYVITNTVPASKALSATLFSALKGELDGVCGVSPASDEGEESTSVVTESAGGDASTGLQKGEQRQAVHWGLNASAETFYACQGRNSDGFHDRCSDIVGHLQGAGVASLEMETHQLFHLARARVGYETHAAACAIGVVNRVNEAMQDGVEEALLKRRMMEAGRCCLETLTRFHFQSEEEEKNDNNGHA